MEHMGESGNIEYEIYNLGNSNPVSLNEFIYSCEKVCNKKALFIQCEEQLGDVPKTYANIEKAKKEIGYTPETSLVDGLEKTYKYLKNK
jgi:UDP-glucuronate 4-epimerase